MEFLAFLYTVLLVAICLMMALLLYRSAKPTASRDDTELKEWLRQQLDAQNRQMEAKLAEMSQQNLAAMGWKPLIPVSWKRCAAPLPRA